MGRCIIVLALPRSGSSCVAGALYRLGVNMGEGYLQPKDKLNKRGYYEDRRWQKINKGLVGSRYGHKEPEVLPDKVITRTYRLALQCDNEPLWGFKGPRACFTYHLITPVIQRVTKDIRVVVVDRQLKAIAKSLQRHSHKAYKNVRLSWEESVNLMKEWNEAKKSRVKWFEEAGIPMHYIYFPDLLNDTWGILEKLYPFVFDGYEKYFCGLNSAAEWVDPKLVHFGR